LNPIQISWEGSLFVHHSLAMVNRELLSELIQFEDLSICHIPFEKAQFEPTGRWQQLAELPKMNPHLCDVSIRHRWPIDFSPTGSKKNVLFQPWEFGTIPKEWLEPIHSSVDEIWTSSHFSKQAFVDDGIPEEKVIVIPHGINPRIFTPHATPFVSLQQKINGRFAFLFIGGAIPRKGVDILVNAYLNTFTRQDNVVLVIKGCEQYTDTMANKIKDLAKRTDIPEIIYFTEDIDPDMLPSLYRSCNLYVQPYRAEGFGLPIAEAMACGLPTIVTGEGSARDFTSEQTSLYIRSVKEYFVENRVSQFETANTPYWYVPDMNHLGQLMRVAYENQNAVKMMGDVAAETIVKTHTWKHGADVIAQRIRALNSGN